MKNYEIKTVHHADGSNDTFVIYSAEESAFFAGYDFMGSVNWVKIPSHDCELTEADDPWQIVDDLEAADEPIEDPATKEYLLKTVCEDIKQASIKTGKQIADIYEMDQIAGIYASMEVWDLDTMKRISLLDLVEPILSNKRWMEQEYRDYCDNVNEYGYDFEGRDE